MSKDPRLYARFTLDFPDSRKVLPLSDAAFRCYVEAVLWSRKEESDGFLARRLALAKWSLDALTELCVNDTENPSLIEREDGWYIHDYADQQDTKAEIDARRERNRAAGQKGGLAKAKRGAKRRAKPPVSKSLSENVAETETKTLLEGGYVNGVRHQPELSLKPPPERCPKHVNHTDPPNCVQCKQARLANEAWHAQQQENELAHRRVIKAAIDDCPLCDDRGMYEFHDDSLARCDHLLPPVDHV